MSTVPNPKPGRKPTRPPARPIPADLARKLYARLMKRVKHDPATGCLIRTVAVNPKTGYTSITARTDGTPAYYYAHRVAWTHLRGPIPEGLVIDHLCKRPACMNVEHLEVVTQRVNILRSNNMAARNARKTHCDSGHKIPPAGGGARRCAKCIDVRRGSRKRPSVEQLERWFAPLPDDDPRHGSISAYTNYRCRCDECKAAASARYYARKQLTTDGGESHLGQDR